MKIVPQKVSGLDVAFGVSDVVRNLLPALDTIPDRYRDRHGRTPMNRLVSRWFFEGLPGAVITPRAGIDKREALMHIATCMGSFEPKHEHKEAGCAYLCALWFERVVVGAEVYESDLSATDPAIA